VRWAVVDLYLRGRFQALAEPDFAVVTKLVNITCVLLSKVDVHKMECQKCHNIQSGVHIGLSVYLWWFNKLLMPLWEIRGKVGEFDEDCSLAMLKINEWLHCILHLHFLKWFCRF